MRYEYEVYLDGTSQTWRVRERVYDSNELCTGIADFSLGRSYPKHTRDDAVTDMCAWLDQQGVRYERTEDGKAVHHCLRNSLEKK